MSVAMTRWIPTEQLATAISPQAILVYEVERYFFGAKLWVRPERDGRILEIEGRWETDDIDSVLELEIAKAKGAA